MGELWQEALRWYNLPWTVLVGLCLTYWILSALTALDLDYDFDADGGSVGGAIGGVMRLLDFAHLRSLPLMLVVTAVALGGWSISLLSNYYLNPGATLLIGLLLAVAAFVPGLLLARCLLWPLVSVFKRFDQGTDGNETMLGRTCIIRSDRVDADFGQAEVSTPEGPLVINVRLSPSEHYRLARGEEAIIVREDPAAVLYFVRPLAADAIATAISENS